MAAKTEGGAKPRYEIDLSSPCLLPCLDSVQHLEGPDGRLYHIREARALCPQRPSAGAKPRLCTSDDGNEAVYGEPFCDECLDAIAQDHEEWLEGQEEIREA